ncbi:MAG: hypothetical protein JSV44_05970 [Candidatus Zixiibacteriota bacterium]|nr:MAG: hypothetical protein JSV44_05970 [candidate division Zixibacteria bacterium]
MSRLWYPVRKFFGNMFGRPLAAATSLLSLLLLFLLFDLVWISAQTVDAHFRQLLSTLEMELFFAEDLPDSTVTLIRETVLTLDGVKNIDYTSKEAARQRLQDLMGTDLLEGFDDNPLPRSLTITFWDNYLGSEQLQQFKGRIERISGISEIYYPRGWLEKTEVTLSWVSRIVLFLGIVIFLTVALHIIHAIRLSVRVHEEEIRQMRLLGAGKLFLSLPYMFEGKFYALAASVAGWAIVHYGQYRYSFQSFEVVLPPLTDIVYFCIIAAAVGFLGGYLGARRPL